MAEDQVYGREEFASFQAKSNPNSRIKKVIAVMSGKGGVGKSMVTCLLAQNAAQAGKKVAVLDADVTGPSIPTMLGVKELATGSETEIYPPRSKEGIEVMSLNLINEDPTQPVIWRGQIIADLVKQFYSDVRWGEIDEMYVDMPPGTGDVPLTVFQSLPVRCVVVVASPQELVSLIVEKAVRMAQMMSLPIAGLVMNMSYLVCPHCGEKIHPYGTPEDGLAKKYGIPNYEELPIEPRLAKECDAGQLAQEAGKYLASLSESIHKMADSQ